MRALGLAVLLVSVCAALAQEAPAPRNTGTIGGIVRDGRTGDPMPDVRVQLSGKSARGTPADPDGRFLFEDLDAGVYTLQVSPPKGAAQIARRTITLAAGQTVDLDILAESSARLSGRVVDQDGKPVAGMVLFLMRQNLLGTLPYLQSGSATSNERARSLWRASQPA